MVKVYPVGVTYFDQLFHIFLFFYLTLRQTRQVYNQFKNLQNNFLGFLRQVEKGILKAI